MNWWDWQGEYYDSNYENAPNAPKECTHSWKAIPLITSTVYNCEACGIKKEEADKCQK